MTGQVHPFEMSKRAKAEYVEAIAYIAAESPQNVSAVRRAIQRKIAQLRRFPESAPVDPDAPAPPEGMSRVAHASGFAIRYAYPVQRGGRAVVYVVAIQRAERLRPEGIDYGLRFLQELARTYERDLKKVVEGRVRELEAARDWQVEQAWADVQAIADGDRAFSSWDEIEQAAQRARLRIREREAAQTG
ncbi:MAG: type II toxin-antitoxin system RelE/ParE family toxin [Candidatus Limnocylindria bacterium]